MKTFYLSAITVCMVSTLQAQSNTIQDLEAQFLQNNYLLIANKLNIDKADAEIVQEKLWNNPTLSISEVNLWKTYQIEEQPYLFGKYGKNQQVSVELEQLIETAGKRKKRVAIKQLEKNNALFDYEELLRELKKEKEGTYRAAVLALSQQCDIDAIDVENFVEALKKEEVRAFFHKTWQGLDSHRSLMCGRK